MTLFPRTQKRIPDQTKVKIKTRGGTEQTLPLVQVHTLVRTDSASIMKPEGQALYDQWLAQNPSRDGPRLPSRVADAVAAFAAAEADEAAKAQRVAELEQRQRAERERGRNVEDELARQRLIPESERDVPANPGSDIGPELLRARADLLQAQELKRNTRKSSLEVIDETIPEVAREALGSIETIRPGVRRLGKFAMSIAPEIDSALENFKAAEAALNAALAERKRMARGLVDHRIDSEQRSRVRQWVKHKAISKKMSDEERIGFALWVCIRWLGFPGALFDSVYVASTSPLTDSQYFALRERVFPIRPEMPISF